MIARLILEDGTCLIGTSFGAPGETIGEVDIQYKYDRVPGNLHQSFELWTDCDHDLSIGRKLWV